MKLEYQSQTTTYYFEDSEADEQYEYSRDHHGNWLQRMGESWEGVYDAETINELEKAFQEWNKKQ